MRLVCLMTAAKAITVGLVAAGGLLVLAPVAVADNALIFVYPNPAVHGQQAVVYGQNFCGASGCSDVTVSVDGAVVARGVKVKSDGSFAAGFTVTQLIGQHTVTATQTDAGGANISAEGGFRVAAGDLTSPTPSTAPPPPGGTPPGAVGSPSPSGATPSAAAPGLGGNQPPILGAGGGPILVAGLALLALLIIAVVAIGLRQRSSRR